MSLPSWTRLGVSYVLMAVVGYVLYKWIESRDIQAPQRELVVGAPVIVSRS